MKRKKCNHEFIHLSDTCKHCGMTRDQIEEERRQEQLKNQAKEKEEQQRRLRDRNADALDGHPTIQSWENAHGRGFWGNSTTGYIYDKDM